MWKYSEKVFLDGSDTGFPRFTTLRRKMRDAQLFGDKMYKKICGELGLDSLPEIVYLPFLNCVDSKEPAFGCCAFWESEDNKYGIAKVLVGLGKVFVEDAWDKIYYQTLPHEIAHVINRLYDKKTYDNHDHGKDFLDIYQLITRYFSVYKDTVTYKLPNDWVYYEKINEAVYYDIHADKIQG